jgi:HD-GYP domain-containing protein (c-di-GMP phosphodiesterase class II)
MREQVAAEKLAVGMFVAELDRPWLGTPFLIQGFVIESQEQIEDLRRHCKHVFVERTLSLGDQYQPDPVEKPAVTPRPRAEPRAKVYKDSAAPTDGATEAGLIGTLGKIFKSAFSTEGAPQPGERSARAAPRAAGTREPVVTIYKDEPRRPAVKKPDPAASATREKGMSSEERDFIEQGMDPAATVRVYEQQPGLLGRISKLFRVSEADKKLAAGARPVIETPVYVDQTTIEEEITFAVEAHDKVEAAVQSVIEDLNKNRSIELDKVNDAVGWMVESVVRNPDGMLWLTRLKSVDAYTYDHGLNTSIYLIAFGRHLGLPEDQLQVIGTVGLMQDVGKIKLPRALIDKREKLTAAELKVFQSHVGHSVEVIRASNDATDILIDTIAQHHERFDGGGYPKGLAGDAISLLGGMAGIADTYAALISARPYAQPMSAQQALHQLYAVRDKDFKGEWIEQFIQCVGVFPVGSLVELNTNEVAVVVSQNRARRLKPRVMLVLDKDRQPYPSPVMIDLLYDPVAPGMGDTPYRVVRGLQPGIYEHDPKKTLDALMEGK